jgi:hypothetical protein
MRERRRTMPGWLTIILIVAAWLLLTQVVLPRLGVPT